MAMRHSWEGFLQLSLISIPVRAYNAAVSGQGEVHFHQIHRGCGGRIRYKKVCEIHGEEVSKDDIVSGYEYEKNQHIEIEPTEIAAVRAKKDEQINIDTFLAPDKIDPIHLSGKTYYLLPTGPAGQKSYQLLHRVMLEKKKHAVAGIVISGHEQRVLIRPTKELLTMSVLYLEHQIKNPSDFASELQESQITAPEIKLAGDLVESFTSSKIDFSQYRDLFTERVKEVVEAKLKGQRVEQRKVERTGPVINLMEALRQSIKKKAGSEKGRHARKPASKNKAG
jgi:DNA end-binding protein Ku